MPSNSPPLPLHQRRVSQNSGYQIHFPHEELPALSNPFAGWETPRPAPRPPSPLSQYSSDELETDLRSVSPVSSRDDLSMTTPPRTHARLHGGRPAGVPITVPEEFSLFKDGVVPPPPDEMKHSPWQHPSPTAADFGYGFESQAGVYDSLRYGNRRPPQSMGGFVEEEFTSRAEPPRILGIRRRLFLIWAGLLLLVIALGVGIGTGVGVGMSRGDSGSHPEAVQSEAEGGAQSSQSSSSSAFQQSTSQTTHSTVSVKTTSATAAPEDKTTDDNSRSATSTTSRSSSSITTSSTLSDSTMTRSLSKTSSSSGQPVAVTASASNPTGTQSSTSQSTSSLSAVPAPVALSVTGATSQPSLLTTSAGVPTIQSTTSLVSQSSTSAPVPSTTTSDSAVPNPAVTLINTTSVSQQPSAIETETQTITSSDVTAATDSKLPISASVATEEPTTTGTAPLGTVIPAIVPAAPQGKNTSDVWILSMVSDEVQTTSFFTSTVTRLSPSADTVSDEDLGSSTKAAIPH